MLTRIGLGGARTPGFVLDNRGTDPSGLLSLSIDVRQRDVAQAGDLDYGVEAIEHRADDLVREHRDHNSRGKRRYGKNDALPVDRQVLEPPAAHGKVAICSHFGPQAVCRERIGFHRKELRIVYERKDDPERQARALEQLAEQFGL